MSGPRPGVLEMLGAIRAHLRGDLEGVSHLINTTEDPVEFVIQGVTLASLVLRECMSPENAEALLDRLIAAEVAWC